MTLRMLALICGLSLAWTTAGCRNNGDDDDTGDPVVWPESFSGEIQVVSSEAGAPACDAVIALQGTKYTGTCDDCDFAFDVQAEITTDNGTDACWMDPRWSYIPSGDYSEMVLAHAPEFGVLEWYGMYYYHDALLTSYRYGDADPQWWVLSHEFADHGTFSRTGDAISWTFDYAGLVDIDPYYNECDEVPDSDATELFPGDQVIEGTLDCDGWTADVFEIDGAAGAEITVSVDTNTAGTAFDPALYVNDPDGCTVLSADDSFDCTFPPPSYRCPAAGFTGSDGVWRVVVFARGSCAGDEAGYSFHVTSPDPEVTVHTGVPMSVERTLGVTGSGTLVP